MGESRDRSDRHPLQLVMDAIPDASILVDRNGRIVAANELVTSMLGWPVDELEGSALEILIPDRFREVHAGHVAGYLDSPEVRPMGVELDLLALHHDGSEIPVLVSLRPISAKGSLYVVAAIRDLSRQTRLHEELLASEQRFRIAAELTADVIQEADLEQDVIQPHSDIDSLMGYPQGEFPRTVSGWIELIHPDDRDRISEEAAQAIETGSDWHFEYRILDFQGSVHHWIDEGIATKLAEDGSILKGIGVTRDVTEAVEAREKLEATLAELHESEERFRIAAAHTADIVQTADVSQDSMIHHNDVDTLLGYPQGTFPSTISGWIGFIHPEDRDRIQREVDQFIGSGGDAWDFRYRILAGDGSFHHWVDRGTVTGYAEDGSANIGVGAIQDITEAVEAQEKLERTLDELKISEALLKSIFASTSDSVAVIDPSGRIVAVNPHWTRFAEENDAPEEAQIGVGANYLAVCSSAAEDDPDAAEVLAGIRAVLDGSRQIFRCDYPCHGPSEERWFTAAVTPLRTESGGAVISHRDISERVKRRQELEEALEEVESLREQLHADNVYLQEEIRSVESQGHIVGESDAWIRVIEQVRLVADSTTTVLLTGETGTGKELIAREVHGASGRSDHPLIKVNCAALPATLIESELFGHEKGAFSGAEAKRQGRFALADKGTIFLDEIGELPVELQAKLLHVLQDGEFEPLGSATVVRVDARVIAATNRDLRAAVREGRFRSDLYHRLAIFPIELPPLRDRHGDIPLLAAYFLGQFRGKHGKPINSIPETTMQALQDYNWPGNVRELENVIERGVIVSTDETLTIDLGGLAPSRDRRAIDRRSGDLVTPPSEPSTPSIGPSTTIEEVERAHVISVLEACNWTVKGPGNAAERLGLKESTLRSRMKRLGIQRPG